MMQITSCAICNRGDAKGVFGIVTGQTSYNCKRCGIYVMDDSATSLPNGSPDGKLIPFLSFFVRRNQGDASRPPHITDNNWKDLALREKAVSVPQKIDRLLNLLAKRTEVAGQPVVFDHDLDLPLVNALNDGEFQFLLKHLRSNGYLDHLEYGSAVLSVKGWERLEPTSSMDGIPGRCFVAMSFSPHLESVFNEAIHPAVTICGFEAIRIDKKPHNGDINDAILAEVKKSQFVIADFTGHKSGVYFEAGFARGLGREVIWTCRNTDFNDAHFDTNHYSHIVWTDIPDLKKQLTDRILATIPNAQVAR